MNNKLIVSALIFISLSAIYAPSGYAYSDLDSICLYIAEDDKKRLRKSLKTNHVKIRKLYKAMRCNDRSLLQFAIERKSVGIGLFMVKKLPVSLLKKTDILKWAEDNGFSESDITNAIRSRIGA